MPAGRKTSASVALTVALTVACILTGVGVARATFADADATAQSTFEAAPDWVPPEVVDTVIAKSPGYLSGWIKQGGTYHVYANVVDSGSPSSGIPEGGVTADVSAISSASAPALVAGSYSVNGVAYNYRSDALSADSPLSGTQEYAFTSTDGAGNTRSQTGYSVGVDNVAPAASDVQTTNAGTAGHAEAGDTVTFTYTEQIDPYSVVAGWTGTSTNVVVHLIDGGCISQLLALTCADDSVQVWDATNTTQLPLGSVDLNRGDYHGTLLGTLAPITFGLTGTPSTMVQSAGAITITLGTPSATADTAGGSGAMVWTPSTAPYDRAGNATSGASVTESGTSDRDF